MKITKKQLPLIVGAVLVAVILIGGGVWAAMRFRSKPAPQAQEEPKKKRVAEPVNVIPVAERPYIQISPLADGRNLELIVKSLNKPAVSGEYELEYQAGSLLQGAFGALQVGTLPSTAKILLDSCSAGGACTYHEDVRGGTLLLRFEGDSNYAVKSDWKYIDNRVREAQVSSKDAKFQINAQSLSSQRYLVVYNSPGMPSGITGTPVSDPYSLAVSGPLTGQATLTMRAQEEGQLAIVGWDGKNWQEFSGQVDGKSITAQATLMELYVVVKK